MNELDGTVAPLSKSDQSDSSVDKETAGGSQSSTTTATDPSSTHENVHPNLRLLPTWDQCGFPTDPTFLSGLRRNKRLFQGRTAGMSSFPWIAQVYVTSVKFVPGVDNPFYFDTIGALINDRYVLTSASTIRSHTLYTTEAIIIGGNRRDSTNFDNFVGIEEIIVHENYTYTNYRMNVALLRLTDSVNATPVCLPLDPNSFLESELQSTKLTVAGLGSVRSAPFDAEYPDYLQYATVQIQSKSDCDRVYSRDIGKLGNDSICASAQGVSPLCVGDDGVPLMACRKVGDPPKCVNMVQVGISSNIISRDECGNQGFPGVYTKVVDYLPWILDNIRP